MKEIDAIIQQVNKLICDSKITTREFIERLRPKDEPKCNNLSLVKEHEQLV